MAGPEEGHTVFEVGAGSGWDAALMGELVGEEGHIYSSEIIPKMAIHAMETMEILAIQNVTILQSDGGLGYEEKAPFDRIIFTAGTYDLPSCMYHQLKEDGILLFVLKLPGGGDLLIQLKKVEGHFEAIKSAVCAFVKMAGKNRIPGLEPPAATDFQLTIHPINKKLEPSGRQWVVDRTDSRFLWTLPGEPAK